MQKPRVKRLKTLICFLSFFFYEETNHAFREYAMSYKVELIEKKDPIKQLKASKSSIKDLFSGPLNERKGFKHQRILKVTLKNTRVLKLDLLQLFLIQQQKQ